VLSLCSRISLCFVVQVKMVLLLRGSARHLFLVMLAAFVTATIAAKESDDVPPIRDGSKDGDPPGDENTQSSIDDDALPGLSADDVKEHKPQLEISPSKRSDSVKVTVSGEKFSFDAIYPNNAQSCLGKKEKNTISFSVGSCTIRFSWIKVNKGEKGEFEVESNKDEETEYSVQKNSGEVKVVVSGGKFKFDGNDAPACSWSDQIKKAGNQSYVEVKASGSTRCVITLKFKPEHKVLSDSQIQQLSATTSFWGSATPSGDSAEESSFPLNTILIIVGAVVVLLLLIGGGFAIWWFVFRRRSSESDPEKVATGGVSKEVEKGSNVNNAKTSSANDKDKKKEPSAKRKDEVKKEQSTKGKDEAAKKDADKLERKTTSTGKPNLEEHDLV